MARKILRQVDSFTPADNTQFRRPMPLGTTVAKYVIRFTGTLAVGVAAATAVLEDSPYGYIRSVDAILNGSSPLKGGVDARGFLFVNRLQYGTPPQSTPPGTAVGSYNVVAEFNLDFAQVDLIPPLDASFWLDTRILSRLELVYLFGIGTSAANAANDFVTSSATSTTTLTSPLIVVYAEEVADAGGFLSRMQLTRQRAAIVSTGFNDIQLPALGVAYRGIAIHTTSGNATEFDATSDDTILTDTSLIADNVVRHIDTAPYRAVRADNKTLYSLETMPAGWEFLDFARSKNLKDLIYTARTRQLILRLNVGNVPANTIVQVYPLNAQLVIRDPRVTQVQRAPVTAGMRAR